MKKCRILVVDDEPGIRESLCGVLEDEGYECRSVGTGEACIEELARRPFEVVLLDVWLPEMDGLETLARIQEIAFTDRPEVVIISGHGTIETAVRATKLGAFDFLEKPLTIDKVTVVVKNALQHRRLELELHRLKESDERTPRIIGESVSMRALRQQLALMAGTFVRLGNELIECSPEEILKTAQRLPDSSCSVGRSAVPVLDYTMNNLFAVIAT